MVGRCAKIGNKFPVAGGEHLGNSLMNWADRSKGIFTTRSWSTQSGKHILKHCSVESVPYSFGLSSSPLLDGLCCETPVRMPPMPDWWWYICSVKIDGKDLMFSTISLIIPQTLESFFGHVYVHMNIHGGKLLVCQKVTKALYIILCYSFRDHLLSWLLQNECHPFFLTLASAKGFLNPFFFANFRPAEHIFLSHCRGISGLGVRKTEILQHEHYIEIGGLV